MKPVSITTQTVDTEVIKNDKLTIVDFWAEWCGPCKMIAPVLEELAAKFAGEVKFTRLNGDDNMATAQVYGIHSIPTLLFFNNGKPVDTVIGALPKSQLEARILRLLHVMESVE